MTNIDRLMARIQPIRLNADRDPFHAAISSDPAVLGAALDKDPSLTPYTLCCDEGENSLVRGVRVVNRWGTMVASKT